MIARKCDICGVLYEIYDTKKSEENWNTLILFIRGEEDMPHYKQRDKDVCPDCRKAINDVIGARKGKK